MWKNWHRHRRKSGSHRRFYQQTKKAANINEHTATDLNTLSSNWKVTVWEMPACDGAWLPFVIFFVLLTHAGKTEKSTSQQQFPIFSAELSRIKRSVDLLSRVTRTAASSAVYKFEWLSQQLTLTFFFHICEACVNFRIHKNLFPNLRNMQL